MEDLKILRRTEPWVPASSPDFVWTPGADVQATWRRYGWVPPSESMSPPPVMVREDPPKKEKVRRVK